MRRYLVYLDKNVVGIEPDEELLEFSATASDEDIEVACADALDTLIGNNLDTGWVELDDAEYKKWKACK